MARPRPTITFKQDITDSESLLIGRDFGVGTDIESAPRFVGP
jgi:hypothetical protein